MSITNHFAKSTYVTISLEYQRIVCYFFSMKKLDLRKYKGYLFDFDGTLVDTPQVWANAESRVLTEYGINRSIAFKDEWALFASQNEDNGEPLYIQWWKHIILKYGIKGTSAQELLNKSFGLGGQMLLDAPYIDGAGEFLKILKQQQRQLGLVSMTTDTLIDLIKQNKVLQSVISLDDAFEQNIVTSDMVKNRKPHPDPYLLGAKQLGLASEECVAFEDSVEGARSSVSANIDTLIYIPDSVSAEKRKQLLEISPYHFKSFRALKNEFQK